MNDFPSTADPGPPALADVIVRLADQQTALSRYIDRRWSDLDDVHLARLLSNHGQNAARLGRLLRDWCAVYGPLADPVDRAFDDALDRISAEWGVDLGPRGTPEDAPAELPIDIDELITFPETVSQKKVMHSAYRVVRRSTGDRVRLLVLR
jgi:hypothetical protein